MEKIKLAIIDDELISRNMIKKLIQDHAENKASRKDGASGQKTFQLMTSPQFCIRTPRPS